MTRRERKKGPKVHALANELGVSWRAVLDAASKLGIEGLQNRITRMDVATADSLRRYLRSNVDNSDNPPNGRNREAAGDDIGV
jgi:Mn-dependent DtxR family transcriptional regulator